MSDHIMLVWNQVGAEEWQAGGLARYYSIMHGDGRYSVNLCEDEGRVRSVAVAHSLQGAQDAALIDVNKAR